MGRPFVLRRVVRFDEIDAAGIVYFARFFTYGHDAMEAMLASLDGGYVRLVRDRKIGLPAVHVEADYASPLRFGDEVDVAVTVERVGRSSIALRFRITRVDDGRGVATLGHTVATTDLVAMKSIPVPDDVRAILARHTVETASAP